MIVILLSSWAAVNRATTPPKRFPVSISYRTPYDWSIYARSIARAAQVDESMGSSPFYQWLFVPELDSFELKRDYLEESEGLLDALRRRQDETGTTPHTMEDSVGTWLQIELDTFLRVCIFTVLGLYNEEPPVDVPELVNQCEKEFTVNWGAKREKRAKQIKGSLENGDDSTVQQTLNLNYKRCRDKGNTRKYCKYQTTIAVGEKTIEAESGFKFQTLSPSEVFQNMRRNAARSIFRPEQMREKNPTAVFRGDAQPRVPRFRPY